MFTGGGAKCGRASHNLPLFQIPNSDSRFPNSEFRMGYGDFGIPHHELGGRGDDPETDFGMIDGGGIWRVVPWSSMQTTWRSRGQGRKENGLLGTGKRVSGVGSIGAKENPAGVNLRGTVGNLVGQLPARADRRRRRVNNRQRARYPITRSRGFMASKENVDHRTVGKSPSNESPLPRVL